MSYPPGGTPPQNNSTGPGTPTPGQGQPVPSQTHPANNGPAPQGGASTPPQPPPSQKGPGAPYTPPAPPPGGGGWHGAPPPPGPGMPYYNMPPQPPYAPRPPQRPSRWQSILLGIVAVVLVVVFAGGILFTVVSVGQLQTLFTYSSYHNNPPAGSFSVIQVVGAIQNNSNDPFSTSSAAYHHGETIAHIKALSENEDNAGILLYMNTPGGGVYESDELYLALMDYKEKTGRPVWTYMAQTCASGGVYVCAAADYISANRNTTTGSIGVYIAFTDTSGLYEKLGIETVLIRSGENKGTGMNGVPITEEQRAVYQGIVDESYEQFVALVAKGRGLSQSQVRSMADGRVYTGQQALSLGLVDELGSWETLLAAFEAETGAEAYYPSFSRQTYIARLIGNFTAQLPRSDTEASLDAANEYPNGVPMALYQPAA